MKETSVYKVKIINLICFGFSKVTPKKVFGCHFRKVSFSGP